MRSPPDYKAKIDRGLSYVCGRMHGGGNEGCGKHFCPEHLHVAIRSSTPVSSLLAGQHGRTPA